MKALHLLVVDDESSMRRIMSHTLTQAGHKVTLAEDEPKALAIFRASPDEFDCLITDKSMPGANDGIELATQIRTISPKVPIFMCTGEYNQIVGTAEWYRILPKVDWIFGKPFTADFLINSVRDILIAPEDR